MEQWDLYTKDRIPTGEVMVRGDAVPENRYRMVIHVCIFNSRGQMLIQQRQVDKQGWSNLWDVSVGGHALAGESSSEAAEREVAEEIGLKISLDQVRPALTIDFVNGFDDMYTMIQEVDLDSLILQEEEVQAVKWATLDEICQMIDDKTFIPYHKSLLELLFFLSKHKDAHTT
ncbi:MAG: NUDIX domain-containing protein [Lachnospiraceae bacterium]|nr:NUDIX domain-containing protein [Lachnospiraceae bacterium]